MPPLLYLLTQTHKQAFVLRPPASCLVGALALKRATLHRWEPIHTHLRARLVGPHPISRVRSITTQQQTTLDQDCRRLAVRCSLKGT